MSTKAMPSLSSIDKPAEPSTEWFKIYLIYNNVSEDNVVKARRAANAKVAGEKVAREKVAGEKVVHEAREYTKNIVDTVREPLVVLDADLRVVSANKSFYTVFKVKPGDTEGRLIYELGNRQWDIPKLRVLLEEIIPKAKKFENFEVIHNFLVIGRKTMLLNARRIDSNYLGPPIILRAINDITASTSL